MGVLSVSASFSVLISLESHYSDESSVILLNLLSLRGLALARTHAQTLALSKRDWLVKLLLRGAAPHAHNGSQISLNNGTETTDWGHF